MFTFVYTFPANSVNYETHLFIANSNRLKYSIKDLLEEEEEEIWKVPFESGTQFKFHLSLEFRVLFGWVSE